MSGPVEVDHGALVRSPRYRRRLVRELRRRGLGETPLEVVHDALGHCCRREDWSRTRSRLARLVAGDDRRLVILPGEQADLAHQLVAADRALAEGA